MLSALNQLMYFEKSIKELSDSTFMLFQGKHLNELISFLSGKKQGAFAEKYGMKKEYMLSCLRSAKQAIINYTAEDHETPYTFFIRAITLSFLRESPFLRPVIIG